MKSDTKKAIVYAIAAYAYFAICLYIIAKYANYFDKFFK
jgi:hypothetical protein